MRAVAIVSLLSLLGTSACESGSSRRRGPPPAYPPGVYPPGPGGYQPYPGGYPPGGPPPGPAPLGWQPPGAPPEPPPGPAPYDPINAVDVAWLRARAQTVMRELVLALPAAPQHRVAGVPLAFDDAPGEVNAFAACIDGQAVMAISDGLLEIEAHLAQSKASDELFGTRKVDEYVAFIAQHHAPGAPLPRPATGFFHPVQQVDARKLARQAEVLDEQIAFVLGHELAHHHLGHLPCTASGGEVGPGDVLRAASSAVPLLNQPNELAADVAGTNNLLVAGARRQGYRWSEAGGLLTMQFFSGIDRLTPADVLFGFERTHPPPALRLPVIQQAAATWRFTGGIGIPIPAL